MRQILLASAAAMVMAGTAYAAEPLLEPLPPAAPQVVEPFVVPSWAGPYVGADIGWGWADFDRDNHHNGNGVFHNGIFDDEEELDGVVGGVFAGWLGQNGTFLYGVELFAQIADIDHDNDDDHRFFRTDGRALGFTQAHGCFLFDPNQTDAVVLAAGGHEHAACAAFGQKVHALFGLEGMIGWGGERTAFLLHAGPALGWFQQDNDFNGDLFHARFPGDRSVIFGGDDDDDNIELGVSVAAEGRFKLTERVFAGVIGRAFWFPDVGDDDNRVAFGHGVTHHDDGEDVTVFEVKARLGMTFGQPPVAAPAEVAF